MDDQPQIPDVPSSSSSGNVREELTLDNEACDAFGLVENTDNGYRMSLKIPSSLFKFIVGKERVTVKSIEKETGTRLSIPRQGEEGDVVITGPQRSGVERARKQIEVISESARQKIPPTHFLCFPLYKNNLEKKFDEFKEKVLKECRGIDASLFQLPSKMHLTTGILTLLSDREVQKAADVLSECYEELVRKYLEDSAVEIELKGVQPMNDDPAKVHVLYANVHTSDGSERLQRLADAIVEIFLSKGLLKKKYDKVKLHATLMHSKFRNTDDVIPWRPFDAREIISSFKDFSFGEYHLDTIHLSKIGTCDTEGRYECVTSVPLP